MTIHNEVEYCAQYFAGNTKEALAQFFADGIVPEVGDTVELVCTHSQLHEGNNTVPPTYEVGLKMRTIKKADK